MVRAKTLAVIAVLCLGGGAAAGCGATGDRSVPAAASNVTQSSPPRVPIGDDAPTPTPAPAGHVPAPAPRPSAAPGRPVQACGLPAPARPAKVQICPGT